MPNYHGNILKTKLRVAINQITVFMIYKLKIEQKSEIADQFNSFSCNVSKTKKYWKLLGRAESHFAFCYEN